MTYFRYESYEPFSHRSVLRSRYAVSDCCLGPSCGLDKVITGRQKGTELRLKIMLQQTGHGECKHLQAQGPFQHQHLHQVTHEDDDRDETGPV